MADHPTVNWTGESGMEYRYSVWKLPVDFDENQDGNYVYARLNENNR